MDIVLSSYAFHSATESGSLGCHVEREWKEASPNPRKGIKFQLL